MNDKIKECEICGTEFKALSLGQKYCPSCRAGLFISSKNEEPKPKPRPRRKNHPNQKLFDEVKAATKLGISYGNYKGRGL